ncbi:MAG: DeoR/GlpR family DNA-binding transcription regulator [Oscillospiraceae bacterium]
MFPAERQQKIFDIVCEQKSIKVTELSQIFDTSEVTIRRDLAELNDQNKLIRTLGGAIARYSVGREIRAPEVFVNPRCVEEKRLISELAYEYIKDYDTIITDSSSTVYELIKLIATGKKKDLIIVTTSPLTVTALKDFKDCKVILIGGEFNYTHNTVEGYMATKILKEMRADKSFLGINGIDEIFGYSTPRHADAEIKTLMIESSMQSFILADNTKFNKTYFAKLDAECDFLITDKRLPGVSYSWLESRTNVLFAQN